MAQAQPVTDPARRLVEDMIHAVARAIDEDRLEAVPDFFVADAIYKVVSRFNLERNLPLAQINCANRGMIVDRIASMRKANVFQPHTYRHIISGIHVTATDDGAFAARANYLVVRTMDDGASALFASGEYRDRIVIENGVPLLRERVVLLNSKSIETLLVIPL